MAETKQSSYRDWPLAELRTRIERGLDRHLSHEDTMSLRTLIRELARLPDGDNA